MKISIGQILFPLIMILFFILLMGCGTYNPPKIGFKSKGGGDVKINPKPINTTKDITTRPSGEVLLKDKK